MHNKNVANVYFILYIKINYEFYKRILEIFKRKKKILAMANYFLPSCNRKFDCN